MKFNKTLERMPSRPAQLHITLKVPTFYLEFDCGGISRASLVLHFYQHKKVLLFTFFENQKINIAENIDLNLICFELELKRSG